MLVNADTNAHIVCGCQSSCQPDWYVITFSMCQTTKISCTLFLILAVDNLLRTRCCRLVIYYIRGPMNGMVCTYSMNVNNLTLSRKVVPCLLQGGVTKQVPDCIKQL